MAARRFLLLLLVPALLLAQAAGLLHGIAHSPLAKAAHVSQAGAAAAPDLAKLFTGHDEDSAACALFDQLAHGDALPTVPVVLLPLVLPAFLLQAFEGLALARWAALFDARGPPALR